VPAYKNHTVFKFFRGAKAFLNLGVGITRGEVPNPEEMESRLRAQARELAEVRRRTEAQNHRIRELQGRLSAEGVGEARRTESGVKLGDIDPQNIVWILGSPRTGSTWLSQILGEPEGHAEWREPFFGVVLGFRNNLAHRKYVNSKQFLLGEPHRDVWVRSMRNLFLDVGRSKFPNIAAKHHLIVKEPNGSMSAPLILQAFPESKLIFLVRDSRDVVASLLDAAKKGSWYGYDRFEASVADAVLAGGGLTGRRPDNDFVERLAKNYVANVGAVQEAYEMHPDGSKVLVRYEDLRNDPLEQVARICDALRIEVEESQLEQAVKKHSWENIPEGERGRGKFHRKAIPGGWREDLTLEQAELVERITAPLLEKFYPG
jgi:LPS sulfotransferase NodH